MKDKGNGNTSVVVFKQQEPFASALCNNDRHVLALCQIAFTSAVFALVYCIFLDSIKAERLHWEVLNYLDPLTTQCLAGMLFMELLFNSAVIAVHPVFNIWRTWRSLSGRLVDVVFISLYSFAIVSSFVVVIWGCSFFNLPKYFKVAIIVEQLRVCMKSYSFIRENAYKVLYPWHKDDTSGPAVWYQGQMSPTIGSFKQYCYFLFAPTLLYRDHYPRNHSSIRWRFVITNLSLFVGGLTIAHQIYTKMQIDNFHWISVAHSYLSTLPLSLALLAMATTSTMHGWMNMWAELLQFADKRFYEDWWCSSTYQEFYRKWNIIPYHFNHAYLYKDIRRSVKSPMFAIFFLILASSVIHEYIFAVSMGFFLPILTTFFAGIGVIVVKLRMTGMYSITFSLFCGFHLMAWCYFIENNARRVCAREETFGDFFYPRLLECLGKHNF